MHIIGLCGKKRAGKSTVAALLCKSGVAQEEFAFADSLKVCLREVFGFTDDRLNGDDKERVDEMWGFSAREAMQKVGTELFRDALPRLLPSIGDRSVWIEAVRRKILASSATAIVISDVRFADEADFVREMGGTVWRVRRPSESTDAHATEAGDFDADVIVDNCGDLDRLARVVSALTRSLS